MCFKPLRRGPHGQRTTISICAGHQSRAPLLLKTIFVEPAFPLKHCLLMWNSVHVSWASPVLSPGKRTTQTLRECSRGSFRCPPRDFQGVHLSGRAFRTTLFLPKLLHKLPLITGVFDSEPWCSTGWLRAGPDSSRDHTFNMVAAPRTDNPTQIW